MSDSKIAALLRDRGGVEPRLEVRLEAKRRGHTLLSVRQAAKRCGVSPTTISKLMNGETRDIRKSNLDKIADGLGINRNVLERASLADAGYLQATSGSSLAEALAQLQGLSSHDLAAVQIEIGRLQQARATEAEHGAESR